MPHSQWFSSNPYSEPNKRLVLIPVSNIVLHLRLGLPKGLYPLGFPVTISEALLPCSILAT